MLIDQVRDQIFVFTGTLSMFTRDQAMQMVADRGGINDTKITKKTRYLVMGQKPGKTKMTRANNYGIQMKTEQWFAATMMGTTPGFVPRKDATAVRNLSAPLATDHVDE